MTKEIAISSQENSYLSVIEKVALDSTASIEKLEKLLELQEKVMAREAKLAFASDFANMSAELPEIEKKNKNTQTKSNYAKLGEINKAISPIVAKWGFSSRFKVTQNGNFITVICVICHKLGHEEETVITLPIDNKGMAGNDNKTVVHGTASSITYGKTIALCAALNLTLIDDDGNAASGIVTLTKEQQKHIEKLLKDAPDEVRTKTLLDYGKPDEMRLENYSLVAAILSRAIKTAKAEKNESS